MYQYVLVSKDVPMNFLSPATSSILPTGGQYLPLYCIHGKGKTAISLE